MWKLATSQLLLASASPRRMDLLGQIGIPVGQLVLPSQPDDEPRIEGESVIDYVMRTSAEKNVRAQTYITTQAPLLADLPILSADTTVALGQDILGKPADKEDARHILGRLSDTTHDVFSAVTIHWRGQTRHALSHSSVTFAPLSSAHIEAYIESAEPFGKAGAYGIQGHAAAFISRIEGSYTGIVGLPLYETVQLLQSMELIS